MEIKKTIDGKNMTLAMEGYLDTTTAPELKQVLTETMDGLDSITMDFGDLEYVSSAGLRVLLTTHNAMAKKGGLKIIRVNEVIMDSLAVTGLANILNVEKA